MLRRLYRCAVRLRPSSFRRRFGDEMLYIFDQQKGTMPALGVMLDCVFSLLRQWMLRPHIGIELPAAPMLSTAADHIPSFETLDPFRPRPSAIVNGAVLSLILFCMTVFAIRYSSIHVLNLRIPGIAVNPSQQIGPQTRLQFDVIPTEPEGIQRKTIASSSPRRPAAAVTRGATIWLDPYVGKYISNYPPAKISIQIEGDPIRGDHLSLSLAAAGHPSLALSPESPARFIIVGAENSYVDFTADAEGRICCLSFVANGNAVTAQRQ
jgi:hypothetical protein